MNSTTTVESQSPITPGGPQGLQLATHVSSQRWQFAALSAVTLVFLVLAVFHFINIIDWAQEPDLGWSFGYAGKNIEVLSVQGAAELSGMQPGDRVVGVNGKRGETLAELRQYVTREMDASNTWIVERDGRVLDITVPNLPLGFASAFLQYGLTWLVGLLFFGLGAVVFVMKPGSRASWAFLMAMFVTGLHIIFTYTSRLSPVWLGHVFTFSSVFLPATILHLAQTFPAEQSWVKRNPGLFIGSEYLLALLLFIVMVFSAPQFADVPVTLKIVATIYLVLAVLAFISTIVVTYLRTNSHLARARAQVLFAALVIGAGPPLADLALALGAGIKLMPHPVFNLIFYIVIPVSIGYSIVRHNLFDVDVYIKRAVGYGIMTALVATAYFLIQTGLTRFVFEPMLGTAAQQVYPIVFALLVVFFFNPISARVQAFVDKLFFRSKLDYKETVLSVGNDIASLLNLEEIVTRIIRTVRQEMFIDTAGIVVTQKGSEGVLPFFVCNEATRTVGESLETGVKQDDPLVQLIARERKLITIYDLLEDIRYKDVRELCSRRFAELQASLGLPLISKDELVGVLFIGHKKSGKFFTRDDIELLETLSTQGAVAIDNAQLVVQMKKEEAVRGNLARYLSPEIVDRVVSDDMEVNLGGQRKVVSVLFSDIRGFTTISESWPPDQLVTILNEYMTDMVAVVFENKGSIDKFVGDAIVAVFGSLVEVDNHAQQAVQAALGMQQRLVDLNVKWQEEYGIELGIGVGINTGEVFLGNIGSPDRMEFTVIGDAVNLAARLEGLTKYYCVGLVVSEFTRKSLADMLCRKLDLVQVKGKKEAVAIYEPVCATADSDETLREELLQYDKALLTYYQQDWDNADAIFKKLHSQYPDRKIYSLYQERIGGLRGEGLPADWDGVFVHTEK